MHIINRNNNSILVLVPDKGIDTRRRFRSIGRFAVSVGLLVFVGWFLFGVNTIMVLHSFCVVSVCACLFYASTGRLLVILLILHKRYCAYYLNVFSESHPMLGMFCCCYCCISEGRLGKRAYEKKTLHS